MKKYIVITIDVIFTVVFFIPFIILLFIAALSHAYFKRNDDWLYNWILKLEDKIERWVKRKLNLR